MSLSIADIKELSGNPSPLIRADIAAKISYLIHHADAADPQKELGFEILRLLARDIEVHVRKAVAESLQHSRLAPHDLILKLAEDVAEVAIPILQNSYVITEEDLLAIVKSTHDVSKLIAIARRDVLSAEVTDGLIASKDQKVLHTVLHNRGAQLTEASLNDWWSSLLENSSLLEVLVHRGGLPLTIAEKLFSVVSDEMKRHLAKQYKLPMILMEDSIEDIREWSTLSMLMPERHESHSDQEIDGIMHQLYTSGRLTYSLIIRALCTGDIHFFEAALAKIAGVPRSNARILMFDSGPLGFKAFYQKAHMPEGFFDAIRELLKISLEETRYGRFKRDDFRRKVVDRIKAEGLDKTVENMSYLMTIIHGNIATSETIH